MNRDGAPDEGQKETNVVSADVVLPGAPLDATVAFFVEGLSFRIAAVIPADDPRVVLLVGHGLRLRLDRDHHGDAGRLRVACRDPRLVVMDGSALSAPNGTLVEIVAAEEPVVVPPVRQSFLLTRLNRTSPWIEGRAGMWYRDLIAGRQNGRFIASHIRIPEAGAVPDYVHFHAVRFQMIFCYKGWVRVVYEDQGAPFVLGAGDLVLQPPRIRHRVLECSAGLEVIEIGCPADHATFSDFEMQLPTPNLRADRLFGGQRFVRHVAARGRWTPSSVAGFEYEDLGIAAATAGLAGAVVARVAGAPSGDVMPCAHGGEFQFSFVLEGSAELEGTPEGTEHLSAGDSVVVPAGLPTAWRACSSDFQVLEVSFPAGTGLARATANA